MLLVPHKIKASDIEGLGVFADAFIPKGTLVWKWDDLTEVRITDETLSKAPDTFKAFIQRYGYRSVEEQIWTYNTDLSRHMNHSNKPSLIANQQSEYFAVCDLDVGDELTCDYREFAVEGCIDGFLIPTE